ncbi:hypothetical protein L1987_77742 [Smallanthus sonchifolius]|uniref:Uncharacterized protein n=1 Tax=Smallanthus sonchifolius TaxID=185202 RepID=A0ACB8Z9U7_9ASTR|nr:hypothetical protein L1987_77742 [Smallanthus sonchifolius]
MAVAGYGGVRESKTTYFCEIGECRFNERRIKMMHFKSHGINSSGDSLVEEGSSSAKTEKSLTLKLREEARFTVPESLFAGEVAGISSTICTYPSWITESTTHR